MQLHDLDDTTLTASRRRLRAKRVAGALTVACLGAGLVASQMGSPGTTVELRSDRPAEEVSLTVPGPGHDTLAEADEVTSTTMGDPGTTRSTSVAIAAPATEDQERMPEARDVVTGTPPQVSVTMTPERPVEGDTVTVRIEWSDAEADTVVAESWCRPSGPNGGMLCADDGLLEECTAPAAATPPRPGSGVEEFSFTAKAGSYHWGTTLLIRSLPTVDASGTCRPRDPFEDVVEASGVIEVASPTFAPAHGDVAVPTEDGGTEHSTVTVAS